MKFHVLDDQHNVVETDDVGVWGVFMADGALRIVRQEHVGTVFVSTVFLGIDHGWSGPARWFETMVFDGDKDGDAEEYQERYETWDEAVVGHDRICVLVQAGQI